MSENNIESSSSQVEESEDNVCPKKVLSLHCQFSNDSTSNLDEEESTTDLADDSDGSDEDTDDEDEDDDDEEENEDDGVSCPICMENFNEQKVAIPETCMHMFCALCLQEWSQNVNTCPIDRRKFNSISILLNKDGTVLEELYVEDKSFKLKHEEFEEPATYCEVCGECDREESLLLCDECDKGFHMDCLNPPLSAVPIEEWYCSGCRPVVAVNERARLQRRPNLRSAGNNSASAINVEYDNDDDIDYIGNEDDLNSIFSRQRDENIRSYVRTFVYGQPSSRPRGARTVATSGRGRGRGRTVATSGRGRGRGRSSSAVRGRSSSRGRTPTKSTSKGKGKKTKKKSKKSKTSSKKAGSTSSKKSKIAIQKAKKKLIKEQLQQFRERTAQGGESNERSSVALHGRYLDLDEFYGDPDDTYEQQQKSPPRSTIVKNTTDVVGSILGGYGTLDPDNVVLQRDGTLMEKETVESNASKKRKSPEGSSSSVTKENKKRRKIRFTEDDDDDEDGENKDEEMQQESIPEDESTVKECETMKEDSTDSEALKAAIQARYLAKVEEAKERKKFQEHCKRLLEENKKQPEKQPSSLNTVKSFKIPKRNKPLVDSESSSSESSSCTTKTKEKLNEKNEYRSKNSLTSVDSTNKNMEISNKKKVSGDINTSPFKIPRTTHDSHNISTTSNKSNGYSREGQSVHKKDFKETASRKGLPTVEPKKFLTLEKKVKLYAEGKLKAKDRKKPKTNVVKTAIVKDQDTSGMPIKHNFISPKYSILKRKGSADYKVENVKYKENPNPLSTSTNVAEKKSISLKDYKKRQIFDEVFGDADLEESLREEKKSKTKKRHVAFAPNITHREIEDPEKLFELTTQELMKKIDSKFSPRKYSIPPDEAKRLLLSPRKQIKDSNDETVTRNKDNTKDVFISNKKRNEKPIAIVAPSPRHDFTESNTKHKLEKESRVSNKSDKQLTAQKTSGHKPKDHKPKDHKPKDHKPKDHKSKDHKPTDHKPSDHKPSDQKSIDQKPSDLSSCVATTEEQKLLAKLNDNSKKRKINKEKEKVASIPTAVSKDEMIVRIKSLLKPYYAKKTITKEQWKEIVKRAVRKVSAYADHYCKEGKIEKLINEYIQPYMKSV